MKIINETEAVNLIKDNDTLAIGASGVWTIPESLLKKIGEVYHKTKHPSNITLCVGISPGKFNNEKCGTNHLIEEGLIGKLISSHVSAGKEFEKCISNNQFPAYTIPLGIYGKLLRAIASNEIGYLTHIGLNTFADPRLDGCKANDKATEDIVELVKVGDKEQLLYKSYPIDICFIKASYADKNGNISFQREPIIGDQIELVSATHNSGGIVVVEVNKIVNRINAKDVGIHKSLVDYIVVKKEIYGYSEEYTKYSPFLVGRKVKRRIRKEYIALNQRKICARRAALEIKKNDVINLGIGMPEVISKIAKEENIAKDITLSIELGGLGGIPLGGKSFGACLNPEAILSSIHNMDLYDGGYLNMAVLGLAEMDMYGNVNVSKFNGRMAGPGGFIDISQSTKKVIFIGTFTSGGLKEIIENGQLKIIKEGNIKKFKTKVEQITFSAKEALKNKQEILYITERAVFKLTNSGVTLIEIAPGISLEKDILNQMDFIPNISKNLKLMDEKIFRKECMNINFDLKKKSKLIDKHLILNKKNNFYFKISNFLNTKKVKE